MDRRKPRFNFGDLLNLIQLAAILIGLGVGWQQALDIKAETSKHGITLEHMQHYLSSKDPHYWDYVDGRN